MHSEWRVMLRESRRIVVAQRRRREDQGQTLKAKKAPRK
jgi:hypothetical protein